MTGYSKVVLIGNPVCDPEMTKTPLGTLVATFSLTVSRRRPNHAQSGDEISHIGIIAYNKHAEIIRQDLKRGRPVMIEGHLYMGKAKLHLSICSSAGCIYRIHNRLTFSRPCPIRSVP